MRLKKNLLFIIASFMLPVFMMAQITTSSITGIVKNNMETGLPGATITATHVPTGTVYTTIARTGGRFDINNMNAGGPYTIVVSFVGSDPETRSDVSLVLGETQTINFVLSNKTTELSTVVVSGTRTSSARTGTETNISRDRLAVLPTIGRNLNDYLRYTPQAKITSTGGISIAGQNNRYNGFLIDGAINNDVFGVSDQATNGGRAGTPPISIDAIDQIVVQVSPFDASLGNFTGGAINAITKSGTNNFHGSAYYIFRNESLSGKTPGSLPDSARVKLTDFNNKTYGFTLGGPIIKNKAFFFINAEMQKDNRPQPYLPTGNATFDVAGTVNTLVTFLKSTYNYDPGDWLNNPDKVDRTNINSRFDFNINAKNKLTLSYRYTKAERTNPSRSTYNGTSSTATSNINFTNNAEFFPSTTHSGNLELNTKLNNKLNNKFRASFTDVVDDRDIVGTPFPTVQLQGFNNGPNINFGSEVASGANLLKQRILNFYDAFKIYAGRNAITLGADIDFNSSYNLFMNRNYGLYNYSNLGAGSTLITSLDAFMNNFGASRYRRAYSLVDAGNKGGDQNTASAADFKSYRLGFFVNDDVKVNDKLTLTVGLRADRTEFSTAVPEDRFFNDSARPVIAQVYDLEGAVSGARFRPRWQLSPRVSFKYSIDEEGVTLRGGIGVFAGRTPLVWPGGVYQNSGVSIGAIDTSRNTGQLTAPGTQFGLQLNGAPLPFRPDINNQYTQTDFGLADNFLRPQGDLNIITKKFHLPAVVKVSLGGDKKIGNGWTLGFDLLYTKNVYEVDWQNVNFAKPTITTAGPDSRLIYSTGGNPVKFIYRPTASAPFTRNPYSNIILIRNSTGQKGFAYNFTLTVDKQMKNGLGFNVSYTYGGSQVHNEATSSVNTSNWSNMEAVSSRNNLPLSTSDFDLGHRVFALISKKFSYAHDHAATTIAFVYNGQSGSPYSYTMSNRSFIGDGVTNNDLMYVPASRAEMDQMSFITRLPSGSAAAANAADIVAQKDQFESFILSDKYLRRHRGQFSERNGARAPFTNVVDLNITQEFSMKVGAMRHAVSVRFDMFNFTNFLDKNAGRQYFFTFDQAQILSFEGFATGNVPTYKFIQPVNNKVGAVSDPASRWTGQITFRYSF